MEKLAGQTAFITGGAQGIGLGIARALVRQGVAVAIADRDESALRSACAELAGSVPVRSYSLDVRDRAAYAEVAEAAEKELGPVSILVNNAGVLDAISPSRMTHSLWDWLMRINVDGVFHGLEAFLPRMIDRGEPGHVVNTASIGGIAASPGFLYHASKFAVVGLSEALRQEVAHFGIGVSVLCPGRVATDIVENGGRDRPAEAGRRSARMHATLQATGTDLHANGVSPDAVGEAVAGAVRENRLYIFTDDQYRTVVQARTEAILAAMPASPLGT